MGKMKELDILNQSPKATLILAEDPAKSGIKIVLDYQGNNFIEDNEEQFESQTDALLLFMYCALPYATVCALQERMRVTGRTLTELTDEVGRRFQWD